MSIPTVTTPTVTSIGTTSATLGANVTATGGASLISRGTVWGTAAAPTGNSSAEGGTTTGIFSQSRTGLTANTAYVYRGYAVNSAGTGYSADGTFTTLPLPPTVGNGSSATTSGFTANWSHPTMGSSTYTYTVEVDDDPNFGSVNTSVASIDSSNTSQAITGLSAGTTYYYRVRSVNAQGSSANSSTSAGFATSVASGTLATSTKSLSALTATTYGTASDLANFTVTGSGLDSSGVTVTPPEGFEVSTTTDFAAVGTSASPLSLGTSATLSTTVYVRLAGTTVPGSYSGNISVAGGAASTQTVAIAASTVNPKALTISNSAVSPKTYDGTTAATITGSLAGVVGSDVVALSGTGTFASSSAGKDIAVESTSTLLGTDALRYTLTQPTGLTGEITKANQTITFGALVNKYTTDAPFTLNATASSGLSVVYSSSDTGVATISGNTVTIVGAGTTTITASQEGDGNFNPANIVTQSLKVSPPPLVSWTFDSTTPDSTVSTGTNNPVIGIGTVGLVGGVTSTYTTGSGVGTDNSGLNTTAYPALSLGSGTAGVRFSVSTSSSPALATGIIIGLDFRQSATSSKYWQLQLSTNGTTFVNASGGTAAIALGQNILNTETAFGNDGLYVNNPGSGSQQFVTGITYTLTGSAALPYLNNPNFSWRWVSVFSPGTTSYAAANSTYGTSGTARFDNVYVQYLLGLDQTITFNSLSSKTYGDSTFDLTATASSSLPVTYSSSDTDVATVAGSTVTVKKAGSTTITASQVGNSSYAAATSVSQTLTVNRKDLTVRANNASKAQGQTLTGGAGSAAFTSSGLVSGDVIDSVTITYTSGGGISAVAGSYVGAVVPSLAVGSSFAASNYNITYVAGDLTVSAASASDSSYSGWLGSVPPSADLLLQYAYGASNSSTAVSPSNYPSTTFNSSSLVMTYYVRKNATNSNLVTPQVHTNLADSNWGDVPSSNIATLGTNNVNGVDVIKKTVTVPIDTTSRKFLRLKISE